MINDVLKTATATSTISAQSVMQSIYPMTAPATLSTLSGGTIQNALKVIQAKYGVTADVIERPLTFVEVKSQIDAGNIVQMDGNDSATTTAAGTPDNPGHSVAIIGYVLPTNGAGAPYYRVWNPWWNTTFYLSSTASTYNLGGVNYKWNQTWYNWRKSATAGTVDNSALNQPVKKENGSQQKVKVSNELIKPEFNQIFKNNFLFPISPKILSNQKVAEFGNTTEQFSFIDLTHWGYAFGTRTINGVSAPAFRLVRGNDSKAVSPITQNETQYKEEIDKLITDSQTILAGASMAILNAMLGLLVSVIATPTAGSIIYGLLTGLCDAAGAPDPKGLIAVVSDYISVTHKIEVLYNSSQGY